MKLKIDVYLRGVLNAGGNFTPMTSREAPDIAAMRKLIETGDTMDMDGGVTDGDIDWKQKIRVMGVPVGEVSLRMYVVPEEDDES